jgi:hypothetical protein
MVIQFPFTSSPTYFPSFMDRIKSRPDTKQGFSASCQSVEQRPAGSDLPIDQPV